MVRASWTTMCGRAAGRTVWFRSVSETIRMILGIDAEFRYVIGYRSKLLAE
jgi:hypothetical protein